MTDKEDKNIYIAISLYKLKKLLRPSFPQIIMEMIKYLKEIKPHKYDYSYFYNYIKTWEDIQDFLEEID